MKKIIALLLLAAAIFGGYETSKHFKSYEPEARAASGAIFISRGGRRVFGCSGTEIGRTREGDGVFLTARHCVANPYTNEILDHEVVSFSDNQNGPFYDTVPIALSLEDDLALLLLRNGGDIPVAHIRDEHRLSGGDSIFNVSFPLGTGKITFHGEYIRANFEALEPELAVKYPQWDNGMPMNITIAHGSSGSGVFSQREHALIGVAVGTFEEGTYNIAIPADRVIYFLNNLKDNTVDKFEKIYPQNDFPDELM